MNYDEESVDKDDLGEIEELENKKGKVCRKKSQRFAMVVVGSDFEEEDEKTTKKGKNNWREWLLMMFTFFYPTVIKKHVNVVIQVIIGVLIVLGLTIFFFWLFNYHGRCQSVTVETPVKPDEYVTCTQRFLTHNSMHRIDTQGNWDNQNQDANFGGPWQVEFQSYQANDSIFQEDMQILVDQAQDVIDGLNDKTFIETIGEVMFEEETMKGLYGQAILSSNISLQVMFDNYNLKDNFAIINLRDAIFSNFNQTGIARVSLSEQLPSMEQLNCPGILVPDSSVEGGWDCQGNPSKDRDYTLGPQQDMYVKGREVMLYFVFGSRFFPDFNESIPIQASEENVWYYDLQYEDDYQQTWAENVYVHPKQRFQLYFNLYEVFVFDYCNNVGANFCRELLQQHMRTQRPDSTWRDESFASIQFFWNKLRKLKSGLANQGFLSGINSREVFINALQQFASYSQLFRFRLTNSDINSLERQDNITKWELIAVPQIMSYVKDDVTGENICGACNENVTYDERCQRNLYLMQHTYAFPFNPVGGPLNITKDNIQDYYINTFVFGLKDRVFDTYSNATTPYFYNALSSQVDNIYCNAEEWRFQDGIEFDKPPVTLTTGIYSCVVQECPDALDRIGNSQTNTEQVYVFTILLLISIMICIILPQVRQAAISQRSELTASFYEAIEEIVGEIQVS